MLKYKRKSEDKVMERNQGVLRGVFKSGWVFDYEREGESFYSAVILVKRNSGTVDEVPVIAPEALVDLSYSLSGPGITLTGSFRSRNKSVSGKSTLQLYFFVEGIEEGSTDSQNILEIEGFICKPPVYRLTPSNREICDLLIAVNRNTRRSDYLPCIVWGRNARFSRNLKVGEKVSVSGRIQSRKFTRTGDSEINSRTAYEVSISRIVLA